MAGASLTWAPVTFISYVYIDIFINHVSGIMQCSSLCARLTSLSIVFLVHPSCGSVPSFLWLSNGHGIHVPRSVCPFMCQCGHVSCFHFSSCYALTLVWICVCRHLWVHLYAFYFFWCTHKMELLLIASRGVLFVSSPFRSRLPKGIQW